MKVIVATCQFPVDADINRNERYIADQMRRAKNRGANLVHFPEGALSGYATADLRSSGDINWGWLRSSTERVLELARRLHVCVVLGSTHPLNQSHRPHNCAYIVSQDGQIVDRYDKRFCAGTDNADDPDGELAQYSPGNHPSTFSVEGITCGVLICHEYRYPELYREYKRLGVELVLHCFHAANVDRARLESMRQYVGAAHFGFSRGSTLPEIAMPSTVVAAAAANHFWISCSNSSARESCWPAFFVRPDGVVTGRLRRNVAGVLISTVDTDQELYDSTGQWRERAMSRIFHSGAMVQDEGSSNRTAL